MPFLKTLKGNKEESIRKTDGQLKTIHAAVRESGNNMKLLNIVLIDLHALLKQNNHHVLFCRHLFIRLYDMD